MYDDDKPLQRETEGTHTHTYTYTEVLGRNESMKEKLPQGNSQRVFAFIPLLILKHCYVDVDIYIYLYTSECVCVCVFFWCTPLDCTKLGAYKIQYFEAGALEGKG